jgi:hypothetical protein
MDTADPGGADVPPATADRLLPPLPPRLAELANLPPDGLPVTGQSPAWADPEELPEVQEHMYEGFRSLPDNPLCFALPAVWPDAHRCWVPDRLPRWRSVSCPPGPLTLYPHGEQERDRRREEARERAEAHGLPEPPPDRLWLLRSPWPDLGVAVVVSLLCRRAGAASPEFWEGTEVGNAAVEMLDRSWEELWPWWCGVIEDDERSGDIASMLNRCPPAAERAPATGRRRLARSGFRRP